MELFQDAYYVNQYKLPNVWNELLSQLLYSRVSACYRVQKLTIYTFTDSAVCSIISVFEENL